MPMKVLVRCYSSLAFTLFASPCILVEDSDEYANPGLAPAEGAFRLCRRMEGWKETNLGKSLSSSLSLANSRRIIAYE